MSIEKQLVVDKIEVVENGCVQVRTATRFLENGEIVSETFHRHVIAPGEDYSQEDNRVKLICAAMHTPDVISAYQQLIARPEV